MNFSSALEKIESSQVFKQFKKQHPDAYFCAGFFVIDYEGTSQQQLDYCLKDGRVFTFIINKEISYKEAETIEGKQQKLSKLNKEIKVDLPAVENIVKEKVKKKINKIIAVLQEYQDKQIWNLNIMTEGFGITQMHIDSDSGEVLKLEKRNMFDFIKRVK